MAKRQEAHGSYHSALLWYAVHTFTAYLDPVRFQFMTYQVLWLTAGFYNPARGVAYFSLLQTVNEELQILWGVITLFAPLAEYCLYGTVMNVPFFFYLSRFTLFAALVIVL